VANAPLRVLHRLALRPSVRLGGHLGGYVEPAVLFDDERLAFEGRMGIAYRYSFKSRP
jgi:hypothetical protein